MEEAEDTRKHESERETQQEREDKIPRAGDATRTRAREELRHTHPRGACKGAARVLQDDSPRPCTENKEAGL